MDINYKDIWLPMNLRNGRINIMDNTTSKKINKPSILSEEQTNSISRNLEHSLLSRKFFSRDNINKIQKKIIIDVYDKSNKKYSITTQDENELLIIMRSYYLQYGKNLDTNINSQVETLNNMVINWSIDEIIKNINQYMMYKQTASTLPMPMEHSQLPSQKGMKILEIKSFI